MPTLVPADVARDVEAAAEAIAPHIHDTPVIASKTFSRRLHGTLLLKLENLQLTGSFKVRGALCRMGRLSAGERARGVVTASAGNHAQGVALAAHLLGVRATVVMPESTPVAKVAATESYGARIVLHGEHYADAVAHALALRDREGSTFVHGFDDPAVIAGQGTVGREILAQAPGVDVVVVPVGGGSLAAGVGAYVKTKKPSARVVGVQHALMPSALRSREAGRPVDVPSVHHLAEGIGVPRTGDLTFPLLQQVVDELVTVTDDEIAAAIQYLAERKKVLAEGAGAAPLAALMHGKIAAQGRAVVAVVSGGNIDPALLEKVIHRRLAKAGRFVEFTATIQDRPGNLARLLEALRPLHVNLVTVEHQREGADLGVEDVRVRIVAETRNRDHAEEVLRFVREKGYL